MKLDIRRERQIINQLLANWDFPYHEEVELKAQLYKLNHWPKELVETLPSLAVEYCSYETY